MDTGKSQRASDWQYPSWQRNQWATWSDLQLSGEAKRRLAAALLASGILMVLAFKLIATNAAHAVLDKPSDKCVLGLVGCCLGGVLSLSSAAGCKAVHSSSMKRMQPPLSDTTLPDLQEGGRLEGRR